jgi:hypothetical protein
MRGSAATRSVSLGVYLDKSLLFKESYHRARRSKHRAELQFAVASDTAALRQGLGSGDNRPLGEWRCCWPEALQQE